MTRPNKGDDKRTAIVRVRFTAAEKSTLQQLAKNAGLTPSDFIRVKTVDAPIQISKATPEREVLIRGLGELGKIGSNVNQIARALNRRDDGDSLSGVSLLAIEHALQGVATLTIHLSKLLGYSDGH